MTDGGGDQDGSSEGLNAESALRKLLEGFAYRLDVWCKRKNSRLPPVFLA